MLLTVIFFIALSVCYEAIHKGCPHIRGRGEGTGGGGGRSQKFPNLCGHPLWVTPTRNIDGSTIKSSSSQKLSGVTIDSNFTFEEHINSLCQKSSQKLHTFSRISQYLSPNKNRILFKTNSIFRQKIKL